MNEFDREAFGMKTNQIECDLSNLTRFISRDENGRIMNVIKYTRTETKDLKIPTLRSNKPTEIVDYYLLTNHLDWVNECLNKLENGIGVDSVTGFLSEKVSTMIAEETKNESFLFRTLMLESFSIVYFNQIVENYNTAVRLAKGVCVKCLK